MDDMIKWIDYETLLLIFSMMILVAVLIDTGIFDYIAVYTFQVWRTMFANKINLCDLSINRNQIILCIFSWAEVEFGV